MTNNYLFWLALAVAFGPSLVIAFLSYWMERKR